MSPSFLCLSHRWNLLCKEGVSVERLLGTRISHIFPLQILTSFLLIVGDRNFRLFRHHNYGHKESPARFHTELKLTGCLSTKTNHFPKPINLLYKDYLSIGRSTSIPIFKMYGNLNHIRIRVQGFIYRGNLQPRLLL